MNTVEMSDNTFVDLTDKARQHILNFDWPTIHLAIECLQVQLKLLKPKMVVGIARGGLIPATMLSHALSVPMQVVSASSYEGTRRTLQKPTIIKGFEPHWDRPDTVVVDDIVDSGETLKSLRGHHSYTCAFAAITTKKENIHGLYFAKVAQESWVRFPWESEVKS